MSDHLTRSSREKTDIAVKNVKALTQDHLVVGIPQSLFMAGIVLMVLSYFVSKLLWLPIVVAVVYYLPMYHMHQGDSRGLTLWLAALSSSTVVWECGRRTPFPVTILT